MSRYSPAAVLILGCRKDDNLELLKRVALACESSICCCIMGGRCEFLGGEGRVFGGNDELISRRKAIFGST